MLLFCEQKFVITAWFWWHEEEDKFFWAWTVYPFFFISWLSLLLTALWPPSICVLLPKAGNCKWCSSSWVTEPAKECRDFKSSGAYMTPPVCYSVYPFEVNSFTAKNNVETPNIDTRAIPTKNSYQSKKEQILSRSLCAFTGQMSHNNTIGIRFGHVSNTLQPCPLKFNI